MVHQGYPPMSLGGLEEVVGMMAIADKFRDAEPDITKFNKLTPREREILKTMSQGLNNRETAVTLVTSEGMIHSYICNILHQLDVGDRSQLMRYANAIFAHRHSNTRG